MKRIKPLIVVNYKTYDQATGKNAEKLTKKLAKISKEIVACPQFADIKACSRNKIRIFAQHVDHNSDGKSTGYITIKELRSSGATGSLLNHSEHRIPEKQIKKIIAASNKENFKIILCVENSKEVKKFSKYGEIYAFALEIPELISSGKSITEYKSEQVIDFVKTVTKLKNKKVLALCGAGITKKEDILSATELGCDGILVASSVVKAREPKKIIQI